MTTPYRPTPQRLERDIRELLHILALALYKLERQKAGVMLSEPWAIAAGAILAGEVAAYMYADRRRRRREHDSHISAKALDRLNGRRQ